MFQIFCFKLWQFKVLHLSDMDLPILLPSNGFKPIENKSYTLNCFIASSNPKPVTKYEWFKNGIKTNKKEAILAFSSVNRDNSGSWICKGVINQDNIIIEKTSLLAVEVRVRCK